ncbi:alpha/beta hydrolase [Thalassospira lohafexi]|uniref:Alpha/beta hydrolase n=2 Tax=Thalassospira lohafexi TaxID=744227 RepID=A0A2N3L7H5_9PROT|nr:alpha/beta hydrolase [Thalassospira lohafexi]
MAERHNWRLIPNASGIENAPLLVVSHGFGTDHRSWRLLLPELLHHYDVGVYDLAGAGSNGAQSFEPDRHTLINAYADDLLDLLNEQEISRCQILCHSVSGMVAFIAASKSPSLFERIFTIAASPRYLDDDGYRGGFSQADLDGLFAAMEGNFEAWANGFAPLIVGESFPAFIREFTSGLLQMPAPIALQTAKFIFQSDFRNLLTDITVPTVLIQPNSDLAVPIDVGRYLHEKLAKSDLHILDSTGHMPHLTAPYAVLHHLRPYFPR